MSDRAAIYTRISRDIVDEAREEAEKEASKNEVLTSRLKSRKGVTRQSEDCHTLAKKRGYVVVREFEDNDVSASTQCRKDRPEYKAMLEAVRAGEVDVIVAYTNSRLTRWLRELLDLIDLHERTGVKIETVVSGSDDLGTADGIMMAQIKAGVDEARRTAERLRRKFLEKVQAGSVNQGARPFGWGDDKLRLHPKESRLVKKAIADVIDGMPTREVARRWNAAGVTTVRAGSGTTATSAACSATRASPGGGPTGARPPATRTGRPCAACGLRWSTRPPSTRCRPPSTGASRGPAAGRGSTSRAGTVRCGTCGSRMHGMRTKDVRGEKRHAYTCGSEGVDHTNTVAGVQTDDLLSALITQRLADVDLTDMDTVAPARPGEDRLAQIPGQIRELMDACGDGVLSGAIVIPQVQRLEAEQARLQAERPAASPRPVTALPDDFPDLDVDMQRAVVETLVEAVVVGRAARRGQPWSPDRLEVVWRRAT